MTLRRTALWCGAGLAAFLGIAALAVAMAVYRPQLVRPWVERALIPRGGTASLAALKISLSPPSLELSGLAIAGPPDGGDLLRLDSLQVELIPSRFFGEGPWVRRLEAHGLVFERSRIRETKASPDLTPLTRLFDIEELSLTDARLRVALPQGDLAADRVRLRLTPGEGGVRAFTGNGELIFRREGRVVAEGKLSAVGNVTPVPAIEVTVELASARLMTAWLDGDVSGLARLRVDPERLQTEELTLTVKQGRVRLGQREARSPGPIRLEAAASATLEGRDLRLEVRGLDLGGLLLARGLLAGSTPEEIAGTLDGDIPGIERAKEFLAPLLPDRMKGMDLRGPLPCRLRLSGRGKERALALELLPRDLSFSWRSEGFGCRLGGSVRAEGPLSGWLHGKARLAGRVQGSGHLERPPFGVRSFRFDAPLAGEIAAPASPGWKLSVAAGELVYEGRPLPLGTLALRGSAKPAGPSYRVEDVDIRSDTLGRLTGEFTVQGGNLGGRLGGAGLPAGSLASLLRGLGGPEWTGWSPAGTIDVAARLEPAEGGSRVAAAVTLGQIGFSSPAGDVMGQNLSGKVDLEALLAPRPRVKAGLILRRGEALWGTVYVDLARNPLTLHAEGTRMAPQAYKDLVLEGGSEEFGRLRIEANAHRAGGLWRHQGRLELRDARLGPIFRTFFRDPLAQSHRDLAGLEMNGTAMLDLSFSGSGTAADLAGTLRLRSGDVRRGPEPPLLSGLDIDLPFAYLLGSPNPGLPRPSDQVRWGRLRLETLRLGGQDLGPLEMPAVLVPNHLYLGGAIEVPLFGARLSLMRIEVDEPFSRDFRIRMAAKMDGLDLARAAGDGSVLEGQLGGTLDPVDIRMDRVTAGGKLTGDLFGGRLDIRRMTVERPFSTGRETGADVTVDQVDLERLSAALKVGRITGRLSGSVEGLRFAYGQPVAFHLKMESVPAEGVSQSVSLKAVNSISLVSTGSSLSGLGVSLMTTFFREFPYEKIGIESRLKNDVFTVRGLIREDGVEYLVKRRLFSGVNVINANPDNRIGFSDMMDRARRATGKRSE